jgi:hypothetical protein
MVSRVSSAVEQRFCKPLVGSSILSPGTTKIGHLSRFRGCQSSPGIGAGKRMGSKSECPEFQRRCHNRRTCLFCPRRRAPSDTGKDSIVSLATSKTVSSMRVSDRGLTRRHGYAVANGMKPMCSPPQPGCSIVAPLWPDTVQRAHCRRGEVRLPLFCDRRTPMEHPAT